jgi:hypothetical protein
MISARPCCPDVNAQAVLVAIVAYARRTGAFVIAEGIESEDMLTFVRHAHELNAITISRSRAARASCSVAPQSRTGSRHTCDHGRGRGGRLWRGGCGGAAGRRGGGAPESSASTRGRSLASASASGRGSGASSVASCSRSSVSAERKARAPVGERASAWRRRSAVSAWRSSRPASSRTARSCETAGGETPVRRASSEPETPSRAIARSARYWATVSGGSWRASSRSIQRLTRGATATSASAASAGLWWRGGNYVSKVNG